MTAVLVPVDQEFCGWAFWVPSATAARVMESPSATIRALEGTAATAVDGARTAAVTTAATLERRVR
ncbi:hypothetical protein OG989_08505 [Micromonospora sp. NBC_01740]|uniref:hypothetical protein n=1 Tax=Micromonospora sp. NBC_01740 TaxID=2975986 RepID=UPI002E13E883|nr:hypothetical protein OG989_08505 [Micromonospora sp. NBC_01740]